MGNIQEKIELILSGHWKQGNIPKLWDGKTAQRIIQILQGIEL
jgi:UDP-N-acetylglucosamine 2-epimerase (non-hydrolysing)